MTKTPNDYSLITKENGGDFSFHSYHKEAKSYQGCEYSYNGVKYIQRTAKTTSKKIGQFVTLWKRDRNQVTTPYSQDDKLEYLVILCFKEEQKGRFLFPKNILLEKNILSSTHDGKRGFRVYPSWDKPISKQALQTKDWQIKYFAKNLKLNH